MTIGRPRKYATPEERKAVRNAQARVWQRAYHARQRAERALKPRAGSCGFVHMVIPHEPPPDAVLAECLAAVAAGPQTITALLCGDPLPGRSALDRQRHA